MMLYAALPRITVPRINMSAVTNFDQQPPAAPAAAETAALRVLGVVSLSHFLNDMIQSLLPALYPMLKTNYALDFTHIGLLTFSFHVSSSLVQPLVGNHTARSPHPYSPPPALTR